jgi:hypothetical protein
MHNRSNRARSKIRRLNRTPLIKRTVVITTAEGARPVTTIGWWTSDGFRPIANQDWAEREYERRGRRA